MTSSSSIGNEDNYLEHSRAGAFFKSVLGDRSEAIEGCGESWNLLDWSRGEGTLTAGLNRFSVSVDFRTIVDS